MSVPPGIANKFAIVTGDHEVSVDFNRPKDRSVLCGICGPVYTNHANQMGLAAIIPLISDMARNEAADNYYHGTVGNVRIWLREGAKNPYEHLKEEAE
jgi:hypothetical protein